MTCRSSTDSHRDEWVRTAPFASSRWPNYGFQDTKLTNSKRIFFCATLEGTSSGIKTLRKFYDKLHFPTEKPNTTFLSNFTRLPGPDNRAQSSCSAGPDPVLDHQSAGAGSGSFVTIASLSVTRRGPPGAPPVLPSPHTS